MAKSYLSIRGAQRVQQFGSADWMDVPTLLKEGLCLHIDDVLRDNVKRIPYWNSVKRPFLGLIKAQNRGTLDTFAIFSPHKTGAGHLLSVAPTRAGKGTGQVIPNLLLYGGSVFVLDIKGENYALTANHRMENMGQKIVRFAPFAETGSDVWNPVLSIRTDDPCNEQEDTRYLCNLLFTSSGSSNDVFWENAAKNFIQGVLLHIRTTNNTPFLCDDVIVDVDPHLRWRLHSESWLVRERSLYEVWRILGLEEQQFKFFLKSMMHSDRDLVRSTASSMLQYMKGEGKLGTSILASAKEQLNVWGYERLHNVTYPIDEKTGKLLPGITFNNMHDEKISIFIVIPPEQLNEYRNVLRTLVGIATRDLRVSYKSLDNPPDSRVLMILDEFPQLAHMQPIEEALSYIAGYNVSFWFFVQDLSQLRRYYPETWQSFMANTQAQCFFGISDLDTAEYVSNIVGTCTVKNISYGTSLSRAKQTGWARAIANADAETQTEGKSVGEDGSTVKQDGDSRTQTQTVTDTESGSIQDSVGYSTTLAYIGRKLIMPEEAMRMQYSEQIIFIRGKKPILCHRPHVAQEADDPREPGTWIALANLLPKRA